MPATFTHDLVVIALPEGNILAVNVPASRHLVSLWDRKKHTIECVRRTSYGKEWMNPDEVERHLMDGSRAAKLALIAARERATDTQVEIIGDLWTRRLTSNYPEQITRRTSAITFGKMEEDWFELCTELEPAKVFSVTIPYSLIKETWVNSLGRVALLLAIRIIVDVGANSRQSLTLEPYNA